MLSTVWIPHRCSQSYTKKRRERKEIEVTRRRRGGVKRRERIKLVIKSLMKMDTED